MSVSEYFKINNWRQGDVIDDKIAIQSLSSVSPLPEFFILLSQNCDILHQKIEDEPYIDLLSGNFGENDGNLFHGKNPRRLQIEYGAKAICFVIHEIVRIKKDKFMEINPDHSTMVLDKKDIKLIVNWVSKRYARAAFPNEFNNRLSKTKQIDKISKNPVMGKVSLIYIDIIDEELEIDQDYIVTMIIGVQRGSDQKTKSNVEDLFYDSFNTTGIEAEINVMDENDIPYKIISTYKRFDWDFRSMPENPNIAAPVHGINGV